MKVNKPRTASKKIKTNVLSKEKGNFIRKHQKISLKLQYDFFIEKW